MYRITINSEFLSTNSSLFGRVLRLPGEIHKAYHLPPQQSCFIQGPVWQKRKSLVISWWVYGLRGIGDELHWPPWCHKIIVLEVSWFFSDPKCLNYFTTITKMSSFKVIWGPKRSNNTLIRLKKDILRMYCIVRPMLPENNVPCTYHCLWDNQQFDL